MKIDRILIDTTSKFLSVNSGKKNQCFLFFFFFYHFVGLKSTRKYTNFIIFEVRYKLHPMVDNYIYIPDLNYLSPFYIKFPSLFPFLLDSLLSKTAKNCPWELTFSPF